MRKPFHKINIIVSILWATAIIAAAIVHAPTFFTIFLLPLLAFSSVGAIEEIGRRANPNSGISA